MVYDFKKVEEEILKFWKNKKIYEKVKKKNSKGKKFYFLQGPPYTSGKLHIGHAWNNSMKDIILRYKRMHGLNVWDRGGYDMHGLPTENAVQKKLKLKTKEEIERYGIDKFVKQCIEFSIEHAGYMNDDLWKLGVWLDHWNAYMPIKKEFISGQWAFFKKAHEQGRLYKGLKVMHWDAETETGLAKHELEYKNVTEPSVFLKFKRKDRDNEYFCVWTTTAWTIPFDLAIMVNPDLDYVKVKVDDEYWIIAKVLAASFISGLLGRKLEIVEEFKGKGLEGLEYEHFLNDDMNNVYDKLKKKYKKVHTIILSKEYVDTSAGTGLVHCAPGCGPEDQEAAAKYGIDVFNTLNERGEIESEGKFKGWKAKIDDSKFIDIFKEKGVLIEITNVEHEYPHSWRSHKPVIFRTTEQWFLKIEDLVPRLLKFDKNVKWVPKQSGESYRRWTENLKDNSVARQRFWGCPLPIWVNEKDEKDVIVIGSVEELEKLAKKKFSDLNLHKPWIDKLVIEKKGRRYKRDPDVCDVWIDSGTASWNCLNFDKKLMKEYFPADLILEATEQTRLWFSLLQICSAIMFNRSCYKNVYCHGMILDYQGTKMSKSLGNIISPYEVVDKYGADVLRYYICENPAGENINFNWEDVKIKQKNLNVLYNIARFLIGLKNQTKVNKSLDLEEGYVISRKNSTLKLVTEMIEDYRIDSIIKEIENLFLDLSRGYIRLVRDKVDSKGAGKILNAVKEVYVDILKMFSIVCPFITEVIWQEMKANKLVKEESVHLCKWPKVNNKLIDRKLEKSFELLNQVVQEGLAQREKIGYGVRWPLQRVEIKIEDISVKKLSELIKTQLNVKDLVISKGKFGVKLDRRITKELEMEGYTREIMRRIQALRKKQGLKKEDRIKLIINSDYDISKFKEEIRDKVGAKDIKFNDKTLKVNSKERIRGKEFEISFQKV